MSRLRSVAILGWVIAVASSVSAVYLGLQVREHAATIAHQEARYIKAQDRFERYAVSRDRIDEYQRQGLID